jgi:hypothetical protein
MHCLLLIICLEERASRAQCPRQRHSLPQQEFSNYCLHCVIIGLYNFLYTLYILHINCTIYHIICNVISNFYSVTHMWPWPFSSAPGARTSKEIGLIKERCRKIVDIIYLISCYMHNIAYIYSVYIYSDFSVYIYIYSGMYELSVIFQFVTIFYKL